MSKCSRDETSRDRLGMIRLFCLLTITVDLFLGNSSALAADKDQRTSSIQDFVAARDRWSQLIGRPLRVEGRISVFGSNELRFAECDVRFVSERKLTRPRGELTNVEVAGQLQKDNGRFVFQVREFQTRPNDLEQLKLDRLVMDTTQPDAYFELGTWAKEQGKFYSDDDLRAAGNELFRDGLMRAHDSLAAGDASGMRELAAKVKEFGVEERLQQQFLHEANRMEFTAAAQQEKPNLAALATRVARDLPGSRTPVADGVAALRNDYEQAPEAVYRVADEDTRRRLERVFYSQVILAAIEQEAAEDGRNGYSIAERIENELPEMTDIVDRYRQQELAYLDNRIGQLTRQQLLDLAGKHEQRGESEQVTNVKRRWLQSREAAAKTDGPRGMMELGEEYLNLMEDERNAARMFQLAYSANPELRTISDWFADHGYVLNQGRWTKPSEAPMSADDDLAEAVREGRPQQGMSGAQVRESIGSAPTSIVRMATAGRISEVWHFKDLGISVQLSRSSQQSELTVLRVTDAP
ncbi:MAG: hypothetical protein KDA52_05280 [Planctomycetaceae bacterium]|nr:hypothetical protein [Planctomycetaceae bacterium]